MVKALDTRRSHPPGASFTEWRAPDGWMHRRMDWPQAPRKAARGSLLFAGGRGDFIEKYLEAYGWWHERGWNVTSFDWRGQGRSRGDIAGGNLASLDPLIDDLEALIADWRGRTPAPHVVVGHSMGGHLLLRTLVERRPALDAAVLIAPMIAVNSAPLWPSMAPYITDFMCLIGWRDLPVLQTPADPARAGSRRQHILTSSADRYEDELWWWEREPGFKLGLPSWGWMRAAYRSAAAAFVPGKLAEVGLPVLLLGTERDRLVSPAAIRRTAALLPHAELHMYRDAGHEILREADPVRLDALARIEAFLERHAR